MSVSVCFKMRYSFFAADSTTAVLYVSVLHTHVDVDVDVDVNVDVRVRVLISYRISSLKYLSRHL